MTNTNCPDRETLELLLLGKLPAPQRETLGEHLLHCAACAASADTLSLHDDWTNALRSPPTPEEHPQILAQAIERAKALCGELDTVPPDASLATQVGSIAQLAALTRPPTGLKINPEEIRFLAPPLLPDEIGRLGQYRILQVLGAGGMGVVFRAEDPRLKRQVALKAMKPAVAASASAKERFLREAQFTAALEHDNIVHIYQVDEDRGVPFIAMQFLRGESLKTRLERVGRLPERDVVRIGKEIAAGLATAHERGLIHRDIKPDNIWLEEKSDRVKILDFGLVRATGDDAGLTQSGMVMGTPRYMAPEQAQGHEVDHRCDLFSLGSVLYHLAAGTPPFAGSNLTSTLMAVVHQAPQPLTGVGADVSPELETLIRKLLEKDPRQRPQGAAEVYATLTELEHDLRQPRDRTDATLVLKETADLAPTATSSTGTVAHPVHSSGNGRRWSAKGIALAAGAGAALLLAGVIIITITNKDGTKTTIKVLEGVETDLEAAPGSKVFITQTDAASGTPSSTPEPQPGWHGWPADAPKPAIAPFDAAQATKHQEEWAAYLKIPVEYTNTLGMKFRLIPPGEFMMGSTAEEIAEALKDVHLDKHWQECIQSEAPQHKVNLTQPIYLGVNEVTQA
ncbi:MAG: protein kinase, partial [Planctomycetaceae bacterium]|nr:protein kinase [Planctomycetaceae bacterium]